MALLAPIKTSEIQLIQRKPTLKRFVQLQYLQSWYSNLNLIESGDMKQNNNESEDAGIMMVAAERRLTWLNASSCSFEAANVLDQDFMQLCEF